jgi:hypothetical protein
MKLDRREFLLKTGTVAAAGLLGSALASRAAASVITAEGRGISLIRDPADQVAGAPPARWAAEELRAALAARNHDVRFVGTPGEARPGDACVVIAGPGAATAGGFRAVLPDVAEALAIAPGTIGGRPALLAQGRDARGLSYALTELADAAACGADVFAATAASERPANPIRGVMRLFASSVEDKDWFNDRAFWRSYLSLLATERFNRLNLSFGLGYDGGYEGGLGLRDGYLHFAYPFLVKVPGYDVRATNLPDAERDANLAQLRFISDEAAARGLEFYLGLWTHSYEWPNSPQANHLITGLDARTQAPYSRDAVALILRECPNISGVTFRTHGESGVPEGNFDFWKTIFTGLTAAGRPVTLDLHAKGMDRQMIDTATATGLPFNIVPKFSAEHMGLPYHQADIRPTEVPTGRPGQRLYTLSEGARSFMRYGYGDLLNTERKYGVYHRIWPGTQRLLLWGDPVFAVAYARVGTFGGSLGQEIFDPLSFKGRKGSGLPGGRDAYADPALHAASGDFGKYRYGYRLWGRMLYRPDTPPETWRRQLRQDYGSAAGAVEISLGSASRILPLVTTAHLAAASNNLYWPELYVNMSVVDAPGTAPFNDTTSPKRFGGVSPLDPQLFSRPDDCADELLAGAASGKYSPIEVAQWLEALAEAAAANPDEATADRAAYRRYAIDTQVQAGLGRFFASKLRAGVLYRLFERTGDRAALEAAIRCYESARGFWAQVAQITKGVYVADIAWGDAWYQHGDWTDRLPRIDEDIALLRAATAPAGAVNPAPEKTAALIRLIQGNAPARPAPGVVHSPPASFRRGRPVTLALEPAAGQTPPREVLLHYRHANQAERWVAPAAVSSTADGSWTAAIPADYAAAPYPLTYYFECIHADGHALYPGLGPTLDQQPYFAVAPA